MLFRLFTKCLLLLVSLSVSLSSQANNEQFDERDIRILQSLSLSALRRCLTPPQTMSRTTNSQSNLAARSSTILALARMGSCPVPVAINPSWLLLTGSSVERVSGKRPVTLLPLLERRTSVGFTGMVAATPSGRRP